MRRRLPRSLGFGKLKDGIRCESLQGNTSRLFFADADPKRVVSSLNKAQSITARQRCEVLMPLFEGPSGGASLGRLLEGPDAGRLALLRKVSSRDVVGLELTVDVVRSLVHPAVAKVISLVRADGQFYVASEHIDGITAHELRDALVAQGTTLSAAVATRIAHDALIAADEVDALLAWKQSPRCIHTDTIWVAEYGTTFLCEPGVADYLHRADPPLDGSGTSGTSAPVRSDILTCSQWLREAVQGARESADDEDHERLPAELELVLRPGRGWRSRRHFADALSALPEELFGSEQDVAETVQALVGTTLEIRRSRAIPIEAIRDHYGDDDETVCFVAPSSKQKKDKVSAPIHSEPKARERSVVSGERPIVPVYLSQPLAQLPDDDDQEVTTAFRPSRIPRSGPEPTDTTGSTTPESDPGEDTLADSQGVIERGLVVEVTQSTEETAIIRPRSVRGKPRSTRWLLVLVCLLVAVALGVLLAKR